MTPRAYSEMTPAERTAARIAKNREMEARIAADKATTDNKRKRPTIATGEGIRCEVGSNSPFVFRSFAR